MGGAGQHIAGGLALVLAILSPAQAQHWPMRPVTMIIPFAPGGAGDVVGRVLAEKLSTVLGQSVVLENVPGAGGMVGSARIAKGPADGSQFVLGTAGTHAMAPSLYARPMYDAVADFAPVVLVNEVPLALTVRKTFPATNLKEFIAYGKANPGKLNFGSGGVGSATHLACVLLNSVAGIEARHVAYRGGALALNDMLSGQIDYMCEALSTSLPHVETGSTKAFAILTSHRASVAANLPTAAEQGLAGFDAYSWYAIFMHAATPAPIVQRLREATLQATASAEVRQRLEPLGITLISGERGTSEYLAGFLKSELAKWAAPIKASGARVE